MGSNGCVNEVFFIGGEGLRRLLSLVVSDNEWWNGIVGLSVMFYPFKLLLKLYYHARSIVFEGRKGASSKILFFLYLNFSKMFVAIKGNGSLPPDSSWCYSPEYHLYLSKKMLKDIIQVFFVTVYWLGIEISNSLTGYRTGLVEKMADRRRRKNSEAESEEDSRNEQTHGVWNNYSIYNFIWL